MIKALVRGWFLTICGIISMTGGGLGAQTSTPAPYDPSVVHYGDCIKITCALNSVVGKPSVYLAVDDRITLPGTTGDNPTYGKLVAALDDASNCFWIVLPYNSKNLDDVYGQPVAPNDKVRLEHLTLGRRLSNTATGLTTFINGGLSATQYNLTQDPVETNWTIIATGTLKIGSFCEVCPEAGKWLAVSPGRSVGADAKEGSTLMVTTDKTQNITWQIDDLYPLSRFQDLYGKESKNPAFVVVSHDQGQPMCMVPATDAATNTDVLVMQDIEDTQAALAKSALRIERVPGSRFFTLRAAAGTKYARVKFDTNEVAFADDATSASAEWALIPDNDGRIKFMNRLVVAYLTYPVLPATTEKSADWTKGRVWTMDATKKAAGFAQGLSAVVFQQDMIGNCILTDDTADTMTYNPAVDSPFTPIFHPAWTLPVPKPGEKNRIEFVVSIDPGTNELDPRDLYVVFAGQPKVCTDMVVIHINENSFAIQNQYASITDPKAVAVMQTAPTDKNDPTYSSLNPAHVEPMALGSMDSDGIMVTTRVAADKPADVIRFTIDLYGPLASDGTPRTKTHIMVKKAQSTDSGDASSAYFENDTIPLHSNGVGYFGFGGGSSKITIKDIKINGDIASSLVASTAAESLINLSSTYKANPGDVLIDRVTVGSRTVTVDSKPQAAYVAWAIGSSTNEKYKNKLFEWKIDANKVGSWVYHDAMALLSDGTKQALSGFNDICASSDGRLFAVAQNKLYSYTWSADGLSNGTWSLVPTKGVNGNDLVVTQVAVGRTREIEEDITGADGKPAKKIQRHSALFIVAKDGNGVRVFQATDASDPATPWVSRSVKTESVLRMAVSSFDLVMALNNYGKAFCLTKLGQKIDNSWAPLYDTLLIRKKKADGSFAERREENLQLMDLAVGGPDLVYGVAVANPPLRPYRLLVRYSSQDKAWLPVEDEQGKDMSGMLAVSLNDAKSFMFIDETGKSYRSDEMGVTFLVATPSGKQQPIVPTDVKQSPAAPETTGTSTTIVDDKKPSALATDGSDKAAGPQGRTRGRPITQQTRGSLGLRNTGQQRTASQKTSPRQQQTATGNSRTKPGTSRQRPSAQRQGSGSSAGTSQRGSTSGSPNRQRPSASRGGAARVAPTRSTGQNKTGSARSQNQRAQSRNSGRSR